MNVAKTNEHVFTVTKESNVFSEPELKKKYKDIITKVFDIPVVAFNVYQYAQQLDKDEDNLVILDVKEVALALAASKVKVQKAVQQLITAALLIPSYEKNIFSLAYDNFFDTAVYDAFEVVVRIEKKDTLQAQTHQSHTVQDGYSEPGSVLTDELISFLEKEFLYTKKELQKLSVSLSSEKLTREKFYVKIEAWQKAMPHNNTTSQKKNYISACIINEDWH